MHDRVSVPSADFIRNIGYWQSEALRHPISITHHGRERLVLAAPDQFGVPAAENERNLAAELAQALNLSSTVLDQIEEGYLRLDEGLSIMSANRVVHETLNRARDALIGAMLDDVLPSMTASVWSSHLQRVLRTRKPETFISRIERIHIRARAFPLFKGVGVVFHNITEEVRLREVCEVSAAQLAAMAGFAEVSSLQLSHHGRIEFADEQFCKQTGFSTAQLEGHRFSDLLSTDHRREFSAALERVLGDAERAVLRVAIAGKGGASLMATVSLAPVVSDLVVRGAYAMVLMLQSCAGTDGVVVPLTARRDP